MTDHPKHSTTALFRFTVVSQVIAQMRAGASRAEAVCSVAEQKYFWFDGEAHYVSLRSIYRWLAAYEKSGLAGLEQQTRMTCVASNVLPPELIDFLAAEKRADPRASIPEVIRRARERGILRPDQRVDRTTVYRACKRLSLPLARRRGAKDRDSRRFAYAHRMEMALCDGKKFRAGATRQERAAMIFLDDASRYPLNGVVGTAESQELFLRGLHGAIQRFGFMNALYDDHGPGFIANDSIAVLANLGIHLVHGEVGYKEGRGKIERFNRTFKADVTRGFDGRPDIDPSCSALELRLLHYLFNVYAHRPHEGLGGDTPWQRFSNDPRPLRFPEDDQSLLRKFEVCIERRVSNDHVVSIDSTLYEMPRGYAGQKVTLIRRLLDGSIGFLHQDKIIDLHPVDLVANAHAQRANDLPGPQVLESPMAPVTAAELAFQRDYGPVVDADGGVDLGRLNPDDPQNHEDPNI